jgi:hypothetical protein
VQCRGRRQSAGPPEERRSLQLPPPPFPPSPPFCSAETGHCAPCKSTQSCLAVRVSILGPCRLLRAGLPLRRGGGRRRRSVGRSLQRAKSEMRFCQAALCMADSFHVVVDRTSSRWSLNCLLSLSLSPSLCIPNIKLR